MPSERIMVRDGLLCLVAPKGFKRGGSAAAGVLAFPPPAYPTLPRRSVPPSQGSKTFLRNHADGIAAMDLFVVPTTSFRLLCGLLIMRHGRRSLAQARTRCR